MNWPRFKAHSGTLARLGTVMLPGQTITGGMVSRTVMIRVALAKLVHESRTVQATLMTAGQEPFVVATTVTARLVAQLSVAVTTAKDGTSLKHW